MRRPRTYWRELGVVALMRMGRTDYAEIGELLELSPADVEKIDEANDERVRTWALFGTPFGEYADLTRPIRCGECGSLVDKAPCLACQRERRAQVARMRWARVS